MWKFLIIFILTSNLYALSPTSYFKTDKLLDKINNYDVQVKEIKTLDGGQTEKPLLIITNKEKFVLKPMGQKLEEVLYYIQINEYLRENGLEIHKIIKTKDNGLYIKIDDIYYVLFEYFENFECCAFQDYRKVGELLAKHDNIMLDFPTTFSLYQLTKAEFFRKSLINARDSYYRNILSQVVYRLEQNQQHFLKLNGHFDLNCGNVDNKFRIIDIGFAHYGWRIDNFLHIFFTNAFKCENRDNIAVIKSIVGYNKIAKVQLNFFEISGIFDLIIGYRAREFILGRKSNLLITDLDLLGKIRSAV